MRTWALLLVASCAGAQHVHRPADGSIAGLARDHDSGAAIAKAEIRVRAQGELAARHAITDAHGRYRFAHLPPGRYSLDAAFAGQPVDIENITVHAGEPTIVDVVFTLGRPAPVHVDFGDPTLGAIDHFRPHHLAHALAIIEGTVDDTGTHEPVAGVVVTAVGPRGHAVTRQALSDDQGRYRFDGVAPGVYVVSTYYSVAGRGQIEVRRGGIAVAGGQGVIVPLWVETAGQ